jgi:hypothetical protein
MKTQKKSQQKKLILKKESITILNNLQLNRLAGGDAPPYTLSTISQTNTTTGMASNGCV